MNTFISKKDKKSYTFIIHKDSNTNAKNLEGEIKKVIPDKPIGDNYSLVYIYYLVDKKFNYPKGESDVLYIGSTIGEKHNNKKSAAFRFAHLKEGTDCKQNITLQYFYKKGDAIGLDIYELNDCRETEKQWRYQFLKKYYALPIADGASCSKKD